MKKSVLFLSAAMLMLVLASCGQDAGTPTNPGSQTADPGIQATEPGAQASEPAEPAKTSDHVVDYKLDIPEGFEETTQEGVVACWYNADGSNINVNIVDKEAGLDATFSMINADVMRETLIAAFKAAGGEEPTITDRFFTTDEVCGLPAYQYSYDIELSGVKMTQIIVCVNADKTYTFTYTDGSGDWTETFEASAKNIQLITE